MTPNTLTQRGVLVSGERGGLAMGVSLLSCGEGRGLQGNPQFIETLCLYQYRVSRNRRHVNLK